MPDLDAVRILMDGDLEGQAQTRTDFDDFDGDFVAEPGQYLTVCSMNLAFEREVIPAFYQLPMDDNEWEVGRFDDIWSGVFLKRAADVLGKDIVTGYPLCEHNKAARPTFETSTTRYRARTQRARLGDRRRSRCGRRLLRRSVRRDRHAMADGDISDWDNGAFLTTAATSCSTAGSLDELDAAATEQVPATADD